MAASRKTTNKNAKGTAAITCTSDQANNAQGYATVGLASQYNNVTERQPDGTVIGAYESCGANDPTTVIDDSATLHTQPQYVTVVKGQEKGTVLGWRTNVARAATTRVSAHDIGNITTRIDTSSLGFSSLTEATLAIHDARLVHGQSLDELQRSNRVDTVLRAARELGINLPPACFEPDVWELSQWVEVQNHLCGYEKKV